VPELNAVRQPLGVQSAVGIDDFRANPGLVGVTTGRGASKHDTAEILIDPQHKARVSCKAASRLLE
jgi:hypothetical protein